MDFKAAVSEAGDIAVIEAEGSLALVTVGTTLRDAVHVLASKGRKKFVLNLKGVDFIDSYGIGELVCTYATIRLPGGQLKLCCVAKKIYDLLQITRLDVLFEMHADEESALRAFA